MGYAVIDLGTNTFHLLIAEKNAAGVLIEIARQRVFVKLASEGIEKIGSISYQKGIDTLIAFKAIISQHHIHEIKAIGTAALRRASNGPDFIAEIKGKTGIEVQLISGDEEARLIYQGVAQAVPLTSQTDLIMDIGGGSVEFILTNKNGLIWAQSFPVGVAILHRTFHKNDPISDQEILNIHQYLTEHLTPLFDHLSQVPVHRLIGASGTFDVIEVFLGAKKDLELSTCVTVKSFAPFYQQLINTTTLERLAMARLPDSRADLIIVALVLIDFVIKKIQVKKIVTSTYALKEGVLFEMMN